MTACRHGVDRDLECRECEDEFEARCAALQRKREEMREEYKSGFDSHPDSGEADAD